jgi:hypothetical protein
MRQNNGRESNRRKVQMRLMKYVSSLALVAAMAMPVVSSATAVVNGDDHHRYYDRKHHDYHVWNDGESTAYVRWEHEGHRRHVEFGRLRATDRERYWEWRHSHPD